MVASCGLGFSPLSRIIGIARAISARISRSKFAVLLRFPMIKRLQSVVTRISAQQVLEILRLADDHEINVWIGGGWGVDALIGIQSRRHHDLDLIIDNADEEYTKFASLLSEAGFRPGRVYNYPRLPMPLRYEWIHRDGRQVVDVLPVPLRGPLIGAPKGDLRDVRFDSPFAKGAIRGVRVACLSAELQEVLHRGYEQREKDQQDIALLRTDNQTSLYPTARSAAGRLARMLRAFGGLVPPRTRQTALVVPALEAESVIRAWLGKDHALPSGALAHITIMYPFLPRRSITNTDLLAVADLARGIAPFDYKLTRLDRFPSVYYLAPEPSAPFIEITNCISSQWPRCAPYRGSFDTVIPHLTIASRDTPIPDVDDLASLLPIAMQASEIWLIEQTRRGWRTRCRFSLGELSCERRT